MTRFRKNRRRTGGKQKRFRRGGSFDVEVTADELDVDNRKFVDTLVPLIVGLVLSRTARGKDVENRSFVKYTSSYAAERQAKGLSVRPVDLRVTGQMLGTFGLKRITIDSFGATLTFSVAPQYLARAKVLERKRRFVGVSQNDLDKLSKELEKRGIPLRVVERA